MISQLLLAVFLAHVAYFILWRKSSPLHPLGLFPAMFLFWYLVGSATLVEMPDSFSNGLLGDLAVDILPMVLVGYVAYLAGVGLGSRDTGSAPASAYVWHRTRLIALSLGLITVGLLAFGWMAATMGIPILYPDVSERRELVNEHVGANIILQTSALVVGGLAALHAARPRATSLRFNPQLIAGALILTLCLVSLATRTYVVNVGLVAVGVWGVVRRRLPWRPFLVLFAVGFAAASLAGFARDATITDEATYDLLEAGGIPRWALPWIYGYLYVRYTVAAMALLAAPSSGVGLHFGALTFGPFLTLLPGHRENWDLYIKKVLGMEFEGAGLPTTLLGTLYADGGMVAIALALVVFGALSARVYRAAMRPDPHPMAILGYGWLWYVALWSVYTNLIPYVTTFTTPIVFALCVRYTGVWRHEAAPRALA